MMVGHYGVGKTSTTLSFTTGNWVDAEDYGTNMIAMLTEKDPTINSGYFKVFNTRGPCAAYFELEDFWGEDGTDCIGVKLTLQSQVFMSWNDTEIVTLSW